MRSGVLTRGVVDVVRGREVQVQVFREADEALNALLLLGQAVVLHLDEVVVPSEYLQVAASGRQGRLLVAGEEMMTDLSGRAAAERDEAVLVLGEPFEVNPGSVVKPFEVRRGGELDQVPIAANIFGQERQVERGVFDPTGRMAFLAAARRDVGLVSDDRLHPGVAHRTIELDRPEEVAMVGQGEGFHAVLDGESSQVLDPARAIEQAEVAMHM